MKNTILTIGLLLIGAITYAQGGVDLKIEGNYLTIEDTSCATCQKKFHPAKDVTFDLLNDDRIRFVRMGSNTYLATYTLSELEMDASDPLYDSAGTDGIFDTIAEFEAWMRTNTGFNTASGGSGAVSTIESFGAVSGGSASANFDAIQAAFDAGGKITTLGGTYAIDDELEIGVGTPVDFDLNGGTITSSTTMRLFDIRDDFEMYNGTISTTFTSVSVDLLGIIQSVNEEIDLLYLHDLTIDGGSNSEINAIKIDNSSDNKILHNVILENLYINNIGQMGVEIIAHSETLNDPNNYVGNVFISNLNTFNTGTVSDFGMGLSISGHIRRTFIDGLVVDGYKDIGIENAAGRIFSLQNFKVINPKLSTDVALSIENTDSQYTSNENAIIRDGVVLGDVGFTFNSIYKPVLVDNLTYIGDGNILTRNAEITNSYLDIGGFIQSINGGKLKVSNSRVIFGTGVSRFSSISNNNTIVLDGLDVTKPDDNQTVLMQGTGDFLEIKNSKFDDGYIQITSPATAKLVDVEYTNPVGTGYLGTGTYIYENVYSAGTRIDVPEGGDFTKVGTTANDQIMVATGDGTLESNEFLTFDGVGRMFVKQDGGSGYGFAINPGNGGGPRLSMGTGSDANNFFEIGAFSGINNFDSKNRDLRLFTSNASLYIESSGAFVGVNKSNPSYSLDVTGNIRGSDGLILSSPDGTVYKITVANGGTLTVTAQ